MAHLSSNEIAILESSLKVLQGFFPVISTLLAIVAAYFTWKSAKVTYALKSLEVRCASKKKD